MLQKKAALINIIFSLMKLTFLSANKDVNCFYKTGGDLLS